MRGYRQYTTFSRPTRSSILTASRRGRIHETLPPGRVFRREIPTGALAALQSVYSPPNQRKRTLLSKRKNFRSPVLPLVRQITRSLWQGVAIFGSWIRGKTLGAGFIVIGVALFLFPKMYKTTMSIPIASSSPTLLAPTTTVATTPAEISPIHINGKLLTAGKSLEPPLRVVVADLKIDLSIVEANVVNGVWETSETTASHGIGSANPGEVGNTVIFAHARDGLFLPLKDVKKDVQIYVLTKDRWYRYRVTDTKFIAPTDVEEIAPTTDETLTLFTCSGFLDSKRLLVTAKPYRP